LVSNGSFDDATGWELGYSWQVTPLPTGKAFHNEGYSAPIAQETQALTAGTTYRVSYTITGSAGSTDPRHWFRMFGYGTRASAPILTGDGIHTFTLTAPVGVQSFQIRPTSGFSGVLDDVSIREVLSNN
jgi:hypothetical protein